VEEVVEAFMRALQERDWSAALAVVHADPAQDPDDVKDRWTRTLDAAFERATVIAWETPAVDHMGGDTCSVDVTFTVRGIRSGDTAENRITLNLIRIGAEWRIRSIKSD
jgi:hypothetical protein